MARGKRKLDAAPKLIILFNGVGVVIQNTQLRAEHSLANDYPHALHGNGSLWIVYADAKDQFGVVSRLKPLALFCGGYPERVGRLPMAFLPIV